MTAHYIANIVQREYDKINIDDMLSEFEGIKKYKYNRLSDEWVNKHIENNQFHRWVTACYLLEECIRRNWNTFEQTDLVYYWAKDLCERKNKELNKKRSGMYY